tara:strand:+ start:1869 stop:2300 length:432 start_codon:yes stop_codon:yes gene_type:complete
MSENIELISNSKVATVFNKYPKHVKKQMLHLRQLVLEAASKIEGLDTLEETLKWGEPSYIAKHGSTIRMDWKERYPEQYALYFQCTSRLVSTYKTIYKNEFQFEGNRAIIFNLDDKIPETELKHCLLLALTYHKRKHLPLMGA